VAGWHKTEVVGILEAVNTMSESKELEGMSEPLYVFRYKGGMLKQQSNSSARAVFYSRDGLKRAIRHERRMKWRREALDEATVVRVRVTEEEDFTVDEFMDDENFDK
jgi:hypothetical protein